MASGLIHGVGAEPHQVLLIAAIGGATGQGLGIPMLIAFIIGLLARTLSSLISATGFVASQTRQRIYSGSASWPGVQHRRRDDVPPRQRGHPAGPDPDARRGVVMLGAGCSRTWGNEGRAQGTMRRALRTGRRSPSASAIEVFDGRPSVGRSSTSCPGRRATSPAPSSSTPVESETRRRHHRLSTGHWTCSRSSACCRTATASTAARSSMSCRPRNMAICIAVSAGRRGRSMPTRRQRWFGGPQTPGFRGRHRTSDDRRPVRGCISHAAGVAGA